MYRESTFQPENADFYLKNSLKFKSQIKHTQYEGKEKMNKIMLIGNLTRDPEISTTPSGVSVCKFTLAVQRNFSNSEGVREADFFNVGKGHSYSMSPESITPPIRLVLVGIAVISSELI